MLPFSKVPLGPRAIATVCARSVAACRRSRSFAGQLAALDLRRRRALNAFDVVCDVVLAADRLHEEPRSAAEPRDRPHRNLNVRIINCLAASSKCGTLKRSTLRCRILQEVTA